MVLRSAVLSRVREFGNGKGVVVLVWSWVVACREQVSGLWMGYG